MKQDKNEAIFDSLAKKSTTLHHILSHVVPHQAS